MCDTMEVSYEDGDIVWVKLGPCWWPGEVWALDKLPSEMTKSFRKTPIAVVKFFEEDSFEYVKNTNLIFKYNCSRKNEFIKKGMDLNRGKLSHMEKFPLDVVRAEKLTHGNEDILQSSEFMPVEVRKTSYAGIFGTPAKTTPPNTPLKKGRLSGSAKRKSELCPGSQQKITHPRILQKYLKGTSDYKAHILVQEPKRVETPVTPDTLKWSPSESDASPNLGEPSPRTPPGNSTPAPGTYACHACNFTATRLNVMILHNKSHSAGFVPYTPPKKHKIKTSPLKLKTVKLESTPGRSSAGMTDKKPRKKPKNITESFPADELGTDAVSLPTKRKGGKIKDKEVKKPKTDIEIKNSLLADWSEDSDESMDILSSLKLTENQTADEDKPEDELDNIGEENSIEKDESGESEAGPAKNTDEVGARKYASCFDFEDDDDAELPIESLGRKIPRLPGKIDDMKKSVDSEDINDRLTGKETTDRVDEDPKQGENCDLDAEIDNLLQETAVPELPSLPGDLKLAENFQKGKAIKFPDKEKDGAERLPIFKTKTFFRSRHSRSQDAIEKYVADNIGADKRPTYMEDASVPTTATDNFTCESESEPIAVLKAETVTEEKADITDVKTTKLTPKIMLKKMKIIIAHKKEIVSPLPVKEIASPTSIGTEDTCLKSPVKNTISNIEDKWSNENLDKLLETDSFVDEKKIESYGTTDDLLGTIEEVPAGIFHITDNASNHIDSSPKKVKKNDSEFEDSVDTLKKTATDAIEDKQQPQIKTDKVPTESDLQIAEALINLPARAGPPPGLLPAEKSSPSILCETPVQKDTMEFNESDPSFNAAESLVQMSEAFTSDPVQIHAPNAFTGVANDPEPDTVVTNISTEPSGQDTLKESELQVSALATDHIENAPATNSSTVAIPKAEENSKIVMSRIMSPKGREKILNFNTTAGLPPKDQKQKVIIRRTAVPKIQRSGGDRFGDTSHEKLVLSNKTVAGRDGDVQTFTIETPTSDHIESSSVGQIEKVKKFFPGKQKLIIKPRGAVITSTGKILQTTESKDVKKDEDILFDINSMPIVLSEEILTPEVLGTTVTSQETTTVKIPEVIPEVKKVEPEKVTKMLSAIKKYNADSPVSKPSNFLLKPVMEKSASPNILSKSKIKSYKNLILMDKQAGVVEQKFPKQGDVKEAVAGKIIKTSTIAQPLKTEKYIIVPSSGGKLMSGERTQKIIMNPQTGKGQLVLGRVNDSTQAENFPTNKPPQKTVAKIIQNRSSNPQTTGNAIMILTNAQGVQSKLVLTSEHQRLLFSKKSIQTTAITPQSVVTSKGTILSPIGTNNRNKNINVSSHSIISPRGQIINSSVGNTVIPSTGQLVPSRLVTKKGPPTPQKLIMTSNPNTRTILTGRPGQTILTSKGHLITQSSIVTSQSKISNIVKTTTVLSQPGRQLKLLKTSPPGKPQVIKTKQGSLSHEKLATGEPTTLLLQSSPGKGQTIIRAPGERPLIIPQRGGVLQLTVAQFEHMQKTGRLVHKSALPSRAAADVSSKGQNPKFIIQKYTNSKRTAEQAGVKQKAVNVFSGSVPPLALIQSESPVKRQKLRELLTVKPDTGKSGMRGMQTSRSSESKVLIEQTKGRSASVPQPIASAVSSNRKTEMESYLKTDRVIVQPENISATETITPVSEVSEGTAPPPTESQLLAVPGENFGGPPDSFFLCVEENGTLTPVNNQPLVLENNQLVPMVIEPPPPPRLRIEDSAISLPLPSALPGEPAEGQTPGIILNTGDQQILLDRPTLLGLLSGEGQQLVTADGQRLILQGDVQQLISAIAANPEIAGLLSGGQQILLDAGDATQSLIAPPDPGNSSSSIGSEFLFPRGNQMSANQDILAAALAGTDVFQQEPLISDSLNIVTGGHNSALGEIDSLSPDFQNLNASVSVHSHVSETSSTLNQPIMSPLEVPTKRRMGKQMDAEKSGDLLSSKNLEDSLAGIGVTTPSVPTSLDLPITVTDPRIAPKVSINPLSLSCGVVYQSSSMLSNSMLSPGVRMSDADSSQSRLDYTYDSYRLSNQTDKISTALHEEREYIHKKSSSKLGSDPILSSHQTEKSKRETKAAPSMPVLSSSMPRLDDSSSDGFVDDHSRPLIETVQSKTYSPISMPLLTEDAVDELPAENSSIEASADTPRDDMADPYISTGENFVFSETKSMPVLMEPEPTVDNEIIMKDGEFSSDHIENVESTHLDENQFEQTEPYTHQESNEISVPDEDPVNESKVDEVNTFEPVLIQSTTDHAESHDTPENSNLEVQSLLSTQGIQEPVRKSNTPSVTEASNFPEDEIPKVADNCPEDVQMSEDVNLHPCHLSGCVTEVASLPEDLHVSDTCIINIEQSPVIENVSMNDITDTDTIALTEETFTDEAESNVVESLSSQVNEDNQIKSQEMIQSPKSNDVMEYNDLESGKILSPSHDVNNIIEPDSCLEDTHNDVIDQNNLESHVTEPENNIGSNYIADPESRDTNVDSEISKDCQDYNYDPEDHSLAPQNNIAEALSKIEAENNVIESAHVEPMEITPDEFNNTEESGVIVECEKQNEDFEMTDDIVNETEHALPVISDNGSEMNEYHEQPVENVESMVTLNNDDHNIQLDNDVIEPSSVPSETCDSPGRPLTPYPLIHTPNDEINLPSADNIPPMDRLHVSCDPDRVPTEVALSPNLNSTPSPELTQNYTDSSSNDSVEIPIQPSISVSQRAVQMCTDDRPNDDGKKSPEDTVQTSGNSFTFDDER